MKDDRNNVWNLFKVNNKDNFWIRYTSKMTDFVKIFNSLNPSNFWFTETSILDVWWEPKFASGSIHVYFFQVIDYTRLTFFCSYFIDLINVEVVRKSCVQLTLMCTFFLLYVDFKILILKSVLSKINQNIKIKKKLF